jgi:hypothetical protein
MSFTRENFLDLVLAIVHERFPLVRAEKDTAGFSLSIEGNAASMENLYRTAAADPESCRVRIERWITELVRVAEGQPLDRAGFEEVRDRVVPMVLPQAGDVEDQARMVRQSLLPGLDVAYAIDSARILAYIPPATFDRWHITLDLLHETALENLTRCSNEIAAHAGQDETGQVNIVCIQTMDGHDASRILLPGLNQRLRPHLASPFVAAVPNRDILVCFRNDADLVTQMRLQVSAGHRTMPHPISERLFLVTPDGLAPYDA